MIVMKFGGTSVANFEAITRTIFIIGGKLDQKPVVVVSALSKVTDLLYRICDAGCASCLDAFEEPCHVAAEFAHHLHSFLILKNLLRRVAMDHVPVF